MRKKTKMDSQLIYIIISVIITGMLAVNAHLSDNKKEKYLKDRNKEIINLQKK